MARLLAVRACWPAGLLRLYAAEPAHSDESAAERRSATGRMLDYDTHAGWAAALLLIRGGIAPAHQSLPVPGRRQPASPITRA
jgi:hypothetical protein